MRQLPPIRRSSSPSSSPGGVFGWRMYVPCIWDAPDRLIADIVGTGAGLTPELQSELVRYLRFKARGVPRRLLQEINSFASWQEGRPHLVVSADDMERVTFYARLEGILLGYFEGSRRRQLFPVAIDEDRWRLGGYYVADWVLQSEGDPFTAADLLRDGEESEFDPLLRVSRRNVERLLDHLASNEILEVIREVNASSTVYGDIAESAAKTYRLTGDIRQQLYGFVARHESERGAYEIPLVAGPLSASASVPGSAQPPWPEPSLWAAWPPGYDAGSAEYGAPTAPGSATRSWESPLVGSAAPPPPQPSSAAVLRRAPRVLAGRYELGELASQGGMNSVYRGLDTVTGREVAIKLLRPGLANDPKAMARFQREAGIARRLAHPQIAATLDVLDQPGEDPALVTEWLNGPALSDQVTQDGPMAAPEVAATGRVLAEALGCIADQQIVRLDLKPANIIMASRGPVIVDLGIALRLDPDEPELTGAGQFVGTPAYTAPELINGQRPDQRADIHALGLVLYFCLTGHNPWDSLGNQMAAIVNEDLNLSRLPVSDGFREVLARALARNREDRFPDARALRDALSGTPEWNLVATGAAKP